MDGAFEPQIAELMKEVKKHRFSTTVNFFESRTDMSYMHRLERL